MKPVRIIIQPSKAYLEWEKAARAAFREQFGKVEPIPKDILIHVKAVAYIKGVAPDLSGMCESVGDCLEGFAWMDDKQIVSWDGSRVYRDKENPRTEIEVYLIDGFSFYARHTSSIEIYEQGGGINEVGVYKRIYFGGLQ
jgi:Holliday junction resolvase RusA-like endonuclease